MFREHEKSISYIYENDFVTNGKIEEKTTDRNTTRNQSPELTGSGCGKNRSSRAAVVCSVLLCVLLLTAGIVLGIIFIQERQQLISKTGNLTNEREQLILKNTNLTNEREQLILKNTNLTNEREQLILKNMDLTNERDQLGNELQLRVGWAFYKFSLYYISNETKNWVESRQYCTERGADLIIINNREEDDFVKKRFGGTTFWIGLTDIDVEGRWKWVDGSTLTSGFSSWWPGEPSGRTIENCIVAVDNDPRWPTLLGWFDVPCNYAYQWICEKRF